MSTYKRTMERLRAAPPVGTGAGAAEGPAMSTYKRAMERLRAAPPVGSTTATVFSPRAKCAAPPSGPEAVDDMGGLF